MKYSDSNICKTPDEETSDTAFVVDKLDQSFISTADKVASNAGKCINDYL